MSRRIWFGAAIAIGLIAGISDAQPPRRGGNLVKVGKYYINTDWITYAVDHGKVMWIYFGGEKLIHVTERGRVFKEGVDINIPDPLYVPQVPPDGVRR